MEMQEPFVQAYTTIIRIAIVGAFALITARHLFKGWPKPLGCMYCMALWYSCVVGILCEAYAETPMYWLFTLILLDKLPEE